MVLAYALLNKCFHLGLRYLIWLNDAIQLLLHLLSVLGCFAFLLSQLLNSIQIVVLFVINILSIEGLRLCTHYLHHLVKGLRLCGRLGRRNLLRPIMLIVGLGLLLLIGIR